MDYGLITCAIIAFRLHLRFKCLIALVCVFKIKEIRKESKNKSICITPSQCKLRIFCNTYINVKYIMASKMSNRTTVFNIDDNKKCFECQISILEWFDYSAIPKTFVWDCMFLLPHYHVIPVLYPIVHLWECEVSSASASEFSHH